jgi:hypothetical protein
LSGRTQLRDQGNTVSTVCGVGCEKTANDSGQGKRGKWVELIEKQPIRLGSNDMATDWTFMLVVAAIAMVGLLTGASLDQSIKQLPARKKIGVVIYSQYSRASDLGQGILFYSILGISAAVLNIAAALSAALQGMSLAQAIPIYFGALFAILHSLATSQAAPTLFRQNRVPPDDELALTAIFDRFARWQNTRCALQVINFGINIWVLITYLNLR